MSRLEEYNEADVREEIIAPLLRALGYRSGTENNIVREQSLRYPKSSLGRKSTAKDPELRGVADYILDVRRLVRWVIEAKAPSIKIATDEIEQCWTYANHPEVRAVYFALCNGRVLQVYQTQHGPDAPPILSILCERFEDDFGRLDALLSPAALVRDFPVREIDSRPPLGPGLRSVVRITHGSIRYDNNNLRHEALNQLQIAIQYGAVERDENEHLVAYLETLAPLHSFQELNEKLGLTSFEMTSADSVLSTDPQKPTRFMNSQTIVLPAGVPMLDIITWRKVSLPVNLECETQAAADGVLNGHVFSGRFFSTLRIPQLQGFVAEMAGPFEVHLS